MAAERRWRRNPGLQNTLPWLIVLIFVAIGYRSLLPPAPLSAESADDGFSAARAFEHVTAIATEPHPMGTEAIAEVRSYIVAQLEELGIEVELQTVSARNYFGNGEPVAVVNVIARIPGTANTGAVALVGHYDTVPWTPGANDNTTAVAAMLETGRALRAAPPLPNDVVLLFTDGEEPAPHFGARAFVDTHSALQNIGLVVNFEASGGSGASILAETSGPQGWLIQELDAADSHPAAFSFITEITGLLGDIGTDFDAFRNAGVTGMHFAYLHGSPIYHTDADTTAAVNRGSLQHHGTHALSIARHFGTLNLSESPPASETVFFPIRPFFIRYSAGWAVPLALLTAAIYSFGMLRRKRLPAPSATAAIRGAGRVAGAGLLAAVLGTVLWMVIVAVRSTPGVAESYAYLLGILTVAGFFAARIATRAGDRRRVDGGVLLIWITLAVLAALTLPGFSYVFVWPALAATIALLWEPERNSAQHMLRLGIVAAPTLILATPPVDFFFQMAQPRPGNAGSELLPVIAASLVVALLAIGLSRIVWPPANPPDAH